MPRPRLRSDQVLAFRSRLVKAALGLFAERGHEGVSLRTLGQALGCSAAAPYRYFSSKRDIFSAIRAAGFDRLADVQARLLDDQVDAGEQLRRLAQGYLEFAQREPHAFRLMFDHDRAAVTATDEERAAVTRAWDVLYGAVRRAAEAGVLAGEPTTQARLFWSSIHGIASLHLSGSLPLGPTPDSLVEKAMDALLAEPRARAKRERRHARRVERTLEASGERAGEWKVW